MALLLAQAQGRHAAKYALRSACPNLARFNIEQSKMVSYGVCANARNLSEAYVSKFSTLYHIMTPVISGIAPVTQNFKFSLKYINYIASRHPLKFGFGTAVTKAVSADIVAQKLIEGKEELDFKRTGLFFCFGAFYSGIICNALYSRIYPFLFQSRFHKLNAFASAVSDNFINTPFILFPTLYAMKEIFFVGGTLQTAYKKYKAEIWEACLTGWKIWIPAHCVTFGVVPTHLRLPYVSCVSFFFFTIISLQQNQFENRRQTAELEG